MHTGVEPFPSFPFKEREVAEVFYKINLREVLR